MIENFKLKVFRVVADNLNYRRAADELRIIQPAVTSRHGAKIDRRLQNPDIRCTFGTKKPEPPISAPV